MSRQALAPELLLQLQEKSSERSLYSLAPILNIVFKELNHVSISASPSQVEPFKIQVIKEKDKTFSRKVYAKAPDTKTGKGERTQSNDTVKLPVFRLHVSLGKEFNVVQHLPLLTQTIVEQHNQMMTEYGIKEEWAFLNTTEILSKYWSNTSQLIESFIESHRDELQLIDEHATPQSHGESETYTLLQMFQTYNELCLLLAKGFQQASSRDGQLPDTKNGTQSIDESQKNQWRITEQLLEKLLQKLLDNATGPSDHIALVGWRKNPQKFLHILSAIVGERTQHSILEQLNTQSRDVFFEHCESELFRKAGLGHLLDNRDTLPPLEGGSVQKKKKDKKSEYWAELLNGYFPESTSQLENIKEKIRTARNNLITCPPSEKLKYQQEITFMQQSGSQMLCALVYSELFFAYVEDKYSFNDAIEQQHINCMVRAELLHLLCQWYGLGKTLGATKDGHMLTVLPLENGIYLSLDTFPEPIDPSDEEIYSFQEHKIAYQASLLDWKADELDKKTTKKQHDLEIIDTLYKEAMFLSRNPNILTSYAAFLVNHNMRLIQAEALLLEAMEGAPSNPIIQTNLAELYEKNGEWEIAIEYYEMSLRTMKAHPERKNWMSRKSIEKKLKYLENVAKRQK